MDLLKLFWISVISSTLLLLFALLVIAYALAKSAGMEPPGPLDELEEQAK